MSIVDIFLVIGLLALGYSQAPSSIDQWYLIKRRWKLNKRKDK